MQFTPLSESKLSTPSLLYKNMQNRNRNRTETPRTYREKGKKGRRSHRDLNSDRWIQSPEC